MRFTSLSGRDTAMARVPGSAAKHNRHYERREQVIDMPVAFSGAKEP
jgi:hypothetical protein